MYGRSKIGTVDQHSLRPIRRRYPTMMETACAQEFSYSMSSNMHCICTVCAGATAFKRYSRARPAARVCATPPRQLCCLCQNIYLHPGQIHSGVYSMTKSAPYRPPERRWGTSCMMSGYTTNRYASTRRKFSAASALTEWNQPNRNVR